MANKIPVLVVVSVELDDVDQITDVLEAMDPARIPHFAGETRVVVGQDATDCVQWLEGAK